MSQAGFNRIEVLVLISVIVVLITIFLNFVFDIQKTIRDSKRMGDVETIAKQLEVHFNREAGQFCKDAEVDGYCSPQSAWFDKGTLPVDPLTGQQYLNLPKDGDKRFMICAKLEKDGNPLKNQLTPPGAGAGVYYCDTSQQ